MLEHITTTVFNANTQTIVNTINCQGVMGAGLALEFKLRYPEMYLDYKARCERSDVRIGMPYLYRAYAKPWILNFPTKDNWRYPSKIEWIEKGLEHFMANYESEGIQSIAFPKLGADRGGLDWQEVSLVMEHYLQQMPIRVVICLNQERVARGIEGYMVEMVNDLSDLEWAAKLAIPQKIQGAIKSRLPVVRFYEIARTPGVGERTYEKVYTFFYSQAISERQNTNSSQPKLL